MKKPVIILFLTIFGISRNIDGQVVINEYSCSNIKQYTYTADTFYYKNTNWLDETFLNAAPKAKFQDTVIYYTREIDPNYSYFEDYFGKTEDWIELFNPGNESINIGGYYLSDNPNKPKKYKIPENTIIPSNGFILFWASGMDTVVGNQIHISFKLSQSGTDAEYILFSDNNGNLIQSEKIVNSQAHHSHGRMPDGSDNWLIFTSPSPSNTNNSSYGFSDYVQKPEFSSPAGFYSEPQIITIKQDKKVSAFYYTLDGTEPNKSSLKYTLPITINNTTVLKAIAYPKDEQLLPSYITFATLFINEEHTLPVISIAGTHLDKLALGNKEFLPWGSIEYFDTQKQLKTTSYGELNSHGQDSWVNDQRSIDFVAKDQMGYSKELKEKLFELSDRSTFQRIILRAAGDDNFPAATNGVHNYYNLGSAHMRDAYFQNLCKAGDMKLDTRTASKSIVYLNGTYWGVYDIREVPDDHDYTKYYYNQEELDLQFILTWGSTWAQYGGNQAFVDWNRLRRFILNNNMANQTNFDSAASELNVKSLADYVISHSLSVSSDWLLYNTGWWRGLNPKGDHKKWGYILWDNDASFAFYINYTGIPDTSATAAVCNVDGLNEWSDPQKHIEILNNLRNNKAFNNYYIMRYNDLMNTVFSCDNMLHQLDSLKEVLEPEMQRHTQRWKGGSYEEWQDNVERLRYFIERRCGAKADTKMDSCYDLTGPYDLVFNAQPSEGNSIKVNSLTINDLPWNATYFGGTNININAIPDSINEFIFENWKSNYNTLLSPEIEPLNRLNLNSDDSIVAIFKKDIVGYNQNSTVNRITLVPTYVKEQAEVQITMEKPSPIQIKIVDITGASNTIFNSGNSELESGQYEFDITPVKYNLVPGIYLVHIITGNTSVTKKMVYNPN